ncbi:hypothetical protein POJ06DRAFT_253097 [Lipomyces tetrasporus]|uniref:Uncharacterized protein n=1 Tax=Lipomyces tetrasporus TaxID=54092 RepID=A0AAD7QT77_9ASCO|nr:uncharacterized protein POJ06DRAFT_253097 [Lipomyces tetrasporus]KAJ8100566.1 hypothetical protein POJ06DRAFT_253097 [Lipomyces tetrasporus]
MAQSSNDSVCSQPSVGQAPSGVVGPPQQATAQASSDQASTAYPSRYALQEHWLPSPASSFARHPQPQQPVQQQAPMYGTPDRCPGQHELPQHPQQHYYDALPRPRPPPPYGHTQQSYQQYPSENTVPPAYNYVLPPSQQHKPSQSYPQQSGGPPVVHTTALGQTQPSSSSIMTNRRASYSAQQQSHGRAYGPQGGSPQLPLPSPSSQLPVIAQQTQQAELSPLKLQRHPADSYGLQPGKYIQSPVRPQLPLPQSSSSLFSRFLNPPLLSPTQPQTPKQQLPPLPASQPQTQEAMKSPGMLHRVGWDISMPQAQPQGQYLPYISQTPGGTNYHHQHAHQEPSRPSLSGDQQQLSYGRQLQPQPHTPGTAPFGRFSEESVPKYDERRTPQPPQYADLNYQGGRRDYPQSPQLEPASYPRLRAIDPALTNSEQPEPLHRAVSLEQYHRSQQQYHRGSLAAPSPVLSQVRHTPQPQSRPLYVQGPSRPWDPALATTKMPGDTAEAHDAPLLASVLRQSCSKSLASSPVNASPSLPSTLLAETQPQGETAQLELARHKSSIAAILSPLSADNHRLRLDSLPILTQGRHPPPQEGHRIQLSSPTQNNQQESLLRTVSRISPQLPSPAYIVSGAAFPPAESIASAPRLSQQQYRQSSGQKSQEQNEEATDPLIVSGQYHSVSERRESSSPRHEKKSKSSDSSDKNVLSSKRSGEINGRERFRTIAPAPGADAGKQPHDTASSVGALPRVVTPRPLKPKPIPVLAPSAPVAAKSDQPVATSTYQAAEAVAVSLVPSRSSSSLSSSTSGSSSSSPRSSNIPLKPTSPVIAQLVTSTTAATPPVPEPTSSGSENKSFDALAELRLPPHGVTEPSIRSSIQPSISSESEVPLKQGLSDSVLLVPTSTAMQTVTPQPAAPFVAATAITNEEKESSTEPTLAKSVSPPVEAAPEKSQTVSPLSSLAVKEATVLSALVQRESSTVGPLAQVRDSKSSPAPTPGSTRMPSIDARTITADTRSASATSFSAASPTPASTSVAIKKLRMGPKSTPTAIIVPISRKRMAESDDSEGDRSDDEDHARDWKDSDVESEKAEKMAVDEGEELEDEPGVRAAKRQKVLKHEEASPSTTVKGERKLSGISATSDDATLDGRAKSKFEHNFSAEAAFNELIAAAKNLRSAFTLTAPATSEDRETANPKKQLDFTEVALHNGREHVTELKISRDKRELCRQAWLRSVIKGRAELSSKHDNSVLRLRQWLKWWWADIAARHSENQLHGSWGKRTQISKAWQAAYDVSASIVHARLRQCERVYELQYRCGWPALVLATMATPALGPTQRVRKSHLERGCDATQISQKDWSEFIALAESRINEIRNVVMIQCGYDGIRRILEKAAVTKPFALQGLALFPPYTYAEDADTIVVMPRTQLTNSRVVFDKRKKNKRDGKKEKN